MIFRCFKVRAMCGLYFSYVIFVPWTHTSHLKLENRPYKHFLIPPPLPPLPRHSVLLFWLRCSSSARINMFLNILSYTLSYTFSILYYTILIFILYSHPILYPILFLILYYIGYLLILYPILFFYPICKPNPRVTKDGQGLGLQIGWKKSIGYRMSKYPI